MANKVQIDPQEMRIQGLLDRYLVSRESNRVTADSLSPHLDEDSIAAFAEGNLSERQAKPIVSHLVDCSFCRNVTAEIVRLDASFAENDLPVTAIAGSEPTKISEVLSGLFSKIFGTTDGAVFAHNEDEEKSEESEEPEEKVDE
jgi:hypothetical protein